MDNFNLSRIAKNYWPFLLGLCLGLCFITFQIVKFDLSEVPGDYGDGRFNNYILEHGHRYITGKTESYWNAPFMYPEKEVISYSDNLIGTLPFYSIWRITGFDRETSFQLWYLILTILNFGAAYLLFKRLFKDPYSAVIGAFVFAFSIGLHSQIAHAQTFPRFMIPLMILAFIKFREYLATKYFFTALILLVWQFYSGIYLGFMLSVVFGIILVYIIIAEKKRILLRLREKFWLIRILFGVLFNLGLLMALMFPYWERSKSIPVNHFSEVLPTIPTIRSYLTSTHNSLLWDFSSGWTGDYLAYWDHQIFPGGIAMIGIISLLVVLVVKKRISDYNLKHIGLLGITGTITGFFFLRYDSYSAYVVIHSFPGFSSMRSMTRIINVELIFFATGAAIATYYLLKRYPHFKAIGFLLLLALLCIDNYLPAEKSFTTSKQLLQERTIAMKQKLNHLKAGSIISYEPNDDSVPPYYHQLDAMIASQDLNLICINAYTATSPNEYSPYWWKPTKENRTNWLNHMNCKDSVFVIEESIGITPVYSK